MVSTGTRLERLVIWWVEPALEVMVMASFVFALFPVLSHVIERAAVMLPPSAAMWWHVCAFIQNHWLVVLLPFVVRLVLRVSRSNRATGVVLIVWRVAFQIAIAVVMWRLGSVTLQILRQTRD